MVGNGIVLEFSWISERGTQEHYKVVIPTISPKESVELLKREAAFLEDSVVDGDIKGEQKAKTLAEKQ